MLKTSKYLLLLTTLLLISTACATVEPTPALIATPSATPESPPATPTATHEPPTLAAPTPEVSLTPEEPIRFAVIGDYGSAGPDALAVAELVKSWEVEFIVTVGDNNYPNGEAETIDENIGQYYHDYIGGYLGEFGQGSPELRFFPSIGNHDWNARAGFEPYLAYFSLPGNERYYEVVRGAVHLFILNSDTNEPDGVGRSSVQAGWLRQALANSSADWQVVVMHHPPYSSGRHTSTEWMQWPFAEWGADVVLAGHDHLYERLEVDGIPHITNGLGGSPAIYDFSLIVKESLVRYNDTYGAMLVEATNDWVRFDFINIEGELIDTLMLAAD